MLEFTAALLSSVKLCHDIYIIFLLMRHVFAQCNNLHDNNNNDAIIANIQFVCHVPFSASKFCINQLQLMSPQLSGILFRIKRFKPGLTFDLCATQQLSTMSDTLTWMWTAVKTDVEK